MEFWYGQDDKVKAGEIVETYIVDRETYQHIYVRAIISEDPAKLPDADILWVRDYKGKLEPKPWAIKVIEMPTAPWV